MSKVRTAVFCDFDGTVTRRDVGYSIFNHFSGGRNDELLPDWKTGRISTRECLVREAAMSPVSSDELTDFLEQFKLDPGFPDFVNRCRQEGLDLFVISDGLDLYIRHLLKKFGLDDLPVLANHGVIENNHIRIEFPFDNEECERCGSCKGERIQEYRDRQDGDSRVVFVGDGYSDACATTAADWLFAKKDLEAYCQMNHIEYIPYDTFYEVTRKLVQLEIFTLNLT